MSLYDEVATRSVFPLNILGGPDRAVVTQTFGLTKRELFAAMALQGFCARGPVRTSEVDWAVRLADALLAELRK